MSLQAAQGARGQQQPAGAVQAAPRPELRPRDAAAGDVQRGPEPVGQPALEAYPEEWIQGQLDEQSGRGGGRRRRGRCRR